MDRIEKMAAIIKMTRIVRMAIMDMMEERIE